MNRKQRRAAAKSEQTPSLQRAESAIAGFRPDTAELLGAGLAHHEAVTGTFDRIISVGMFEHVGINCYDAFFAKCADSLAEDGVMRSDGRAGRATPMHGSPNTSSRVGTFRPCPR